MSIWRGWKPGAWRAGSWGRRPMIYATTSITIAITAEVVITAYQAE